MFSRTVIVLCVAVLSISWGQAWVVRMHHEDYEPLYPAILNREYMGPRDEMRRLPASYRNLVQTLYDYLVSPKEKYLQVLSRTSFAFEQITDYETDYIHMFLKRILSLKDVLKKPKTRAKFVLTMIHFALVRLAESCDELEMTIKPFIIDHESTPTENAIGLNAEIRQSDIKFILMMVNSAKLKLQHLQNQMNYYTDEFLAATDLEKNVGGLSLHGILRYTVSAMTSVRSSWIEWKVMLHYSNVVKS